MLQALPLAIGQLTDPKILRVLAKSLLVTLAICVAAGLLFAAALRHYWAQQADGLHQDHIVVLGGLIVLLVTLIGFRAVAVPVLGIFADEVVEAVEARHYPQALREARRVSFATALRLGVRSAARLLLVNLLALPLYAVLLVTAIGPFVAFLAINAVLTGRDLGEMVAVRHLDAAQLAGWLRDTRLERALLGAAATALFAVPVANLLAPIVGASLATHMFHRRRPA